ncbi:protein HBS1-like [Macrosteles quadrilineatus]|uniref:protein HBS1-like n=1 Tax=Macrosteles quadrilineatus TaxID=74068 RepID=UPI0023E30792|nr:protein HBS1-like [Macrosteles quadrilineatus]
MRWVHDILTPRRGVRGRRQSFPGRPAESRLSSNGKRTEPNHYQPYTKAAAPLAVVLHQQSLSEPAVITKLVAQLHKSSGEVIKRRPRCLTKNSSALVVLETSRPVCVELYRDVKELGRFMLRVGGATIAAGLITKIL